MVNLKAEVQAYHQALGQWVVVLVHAGRQRVVAIAHVGVKSLILRKEKGVSGCCVEPERTQRQSSQKGDGDLITQRDRVDPQVRSLIQVPRIPGIAIVAGWGIVRSGHLPIAGVLLRFPVRVGGC